MFTLRDAIKEGVYGKDEVKKFKEQWNPQSGSRVWIISGHVLYSSIDGRYLKSCDARSLDSNSQEKNLDSNFVSKSGYVFDVCVLHESCPVKILVALSGGVVDAYQYCLSNQEWKKEGSFSLFSQRDRVKLEWIHCHRRINTFLWCERREDAKDGANYALFKRILPPDENSEISEDTVRPIYPLLSNCPKIEIAAFGESFCLVPKLAGNTSIYVICNHGSQFRLCNLNCDYSWKSCRYDALPDSQVDFMILITRSLGTWKYTDVKYRLCHSLCIGSEKIAFLCDDTMVVFVNSSGDICEKRQLVKFMGEVKECFVCKQFIFLFTEDKLYVCCTDTGCCIESLDLPYIGPPGGIWHYCSSIPLLGVYTDHTIYQLQYKSINEIVNSPNFSQDNVMKYFSMKQLQFLALLRDLTREDAVNSEVHLISSPHHMLQSKALLLAALHWHRSNVSNRYAYQASNIQSLMSSQEHSWPGRETKLRKVLKQQVECFCAIERERLKFFSNNFNTH